MNAYATSNTPTLTEDPFGADPENPEHLLPVLRPHLVDLGHVGVGLKHPLVFQIPFCSWKLANDCYVERARRVDELIAAGDHLSALWFFERPHRMPLLYEWFTSGEITLETLRETIPHAWVDTENEHEHRAKSLSLFKALAFVTDTPRRPRGRTLTIFHGIEHLEDERGIAWTLSLETARYFAHRFGRNDHVLRGSIPSTKILAYFVSRGEEEIVVDPADVTDVEIFE